MVKAISDVNMHTYLLMGENFDSADGVLDKCAWDEFFARKETWQRLQQQKEKQIEDIKNRK